ncbi:fermentation-respiration switch protein FrsA (DUF1100 family) [Caulobacter ginsengisoli]|uniref:Fermentation-respiration switch protein FrsA (DUF1100 family) n=1 Tax=Caulobacter ginsengisoli TaxID=400775 RepID=A0ABU0ISU2_9CAUL|nr:alpha/beta hydrolase [Caulobacter ginsengisoli]MDQ0465069.1 fermentation-respiration switch protein FrsA (DUF1100 family) [Caulobacter ginsengisoli]
MALTMYLALVAVMYVDQRKYLYQPDPTFIAPPADGPPIQVIHLTAADGTRLVAWYLPPEGDKPVLLFFNGNGQGLAHQKWRWKRFAEAGVGFFAVGYRGYAGSEGHPSEHGLIEDSNAAYDWVAARYPAGKIVIQGYSLGSGLAVRLAAQRPARALILEAPYTSTTDVAAIRFPWLPVRLLMKDRFQSTDWIGKVHIPVLIVHGTRDSVIPFRFGQQLYAMASQPKRFEAMRGSDHSTLVRDGLYRHVWAFLSVADPEKTPARVSGPGL